VSGPVLYLDSVSLYFSRPSGFLTALVVDVAMAQYPSIDPYLRSKYELGIDAKIVVMGNTGLTSVSSFHALLIRATGVGKTSLLHRYTQNRFDPKNTTSTTGAFFVTKKVTVNGFKVRLQLWDTAGQERFRSMVRTSLSRAPCKFFTANLTGTHVLSGSQRCTIIVRHHEFNNL
jgi:hypothetical protein